MKSRRCFREDYSMLYGVSGEWVEDPTALVQETAIFGKQS
jgi:hypothetical protein